MTLENKWRPKISMHLYLNINSLWLFCCWARRGVWLNCDHNSLVRYILLAIRFSSVRAWFYAKTHRSRKNVLACLGMDFSNSIFFLAKRLWRLILALSLRNGALRRIRSRRLLTQTSTVLKHSNFYVVSSSRALGLLISRNLMYGDILEIWDP